ncbi:phosphatase PAP2 family protein [Solilutibacter silvestris]|uniref:Acid phosphatase n=1 Tax=Solilutibacter silvestris TaxID=1645665 RepID=A0A2K1PY74_9GAMM|nr:phosphatase PAP2 family protein [Lysobacter silvestris]PNS07731.1 PAP2 superfamily protein [Lysobacter silvestris]
MTMMKSILATALLAACFAAPASAKDGKAKAPYLHYLSDAQIADDVELLPPPTSMGSAEDIADREVTERAYVGRSAADAAQAAKEESFDVFAFSSVLGKEFDKDKLPRTAELFADVKKNLAAAKDAGKARWKRERPCPVNSCQWDPEKDASDWKNRDYGYPSGHSTRATAFALLLDAMFPTRKPQLDAFGQQAGWRRVIRGVHTPQDIYAGRVLGQALARDLLANQDFRKRLDDAASELRAAGFKDAVTP